MENLFSKKILPSITLYDINSAQLLTEAFIKGGLDIMEITFRTGIALPAIQRVSKEFPDFNIGAGTILSVQQISLALDAGAQFGLSPGYNPHVVNVAHEQKFPFIPGVATPSDIERALESGCKILKFFPAEPLGGVDMLKSLIGPYKHLDIKFIPMGGINETNLKEYIEIENVVAVGGSWLSPRKPVQNRDVEKISELVKRSIDLIPT